MMQYKTFWPLLGSSLSATLAALFTLLGPSVRVDLFSQQALPCSRYGFCGLSVPLAPVGILVTSVIGYGLYRLVGHVIHTAEMFEDCYRTQRSEIVVLCRVAILAYTVWTDLAIAGTSLFYLWYTMIAVTGLAVYGGCHATEYKLKRARRGATAQHQDNVGHDKRSDKFNAVLSNIGHPRVQVVWHESITDDLTGKEVGDQFLVQAPASSR